MSKLFYNLHLLDNKDGAVATTSIEHEFTDYFTLYQITELNNCFSIENGIIEDYLANDIGWPLMSERMKIIFEQFNSQGVHWIKTNVYDLRSANYYNYYVLGFKEKLVPVFSLDKIKYLDFFPQPDKYDLNIVISARLKSKLHMEKITGIDFSSTLVSK
jgi:hypothetical protein